MTWLQIVPNHVAVCHERPMHSSNAQNGFTSNYFCAGCMTTGVVVSREGDIAVTLYLQQ